MSKRGTNRPATEPLRLFLTGFMGAGKTSVGQLVAEKLGIEFRDIDEVIESESGMSVADIFAGQGEPAFRELERTTIARLAAEPASRVIGLGGGAILDPANRSAISRSGTLVWLEASPESILARVDTQPGKRPLLAGGSREERLEKVRALLEKRKSSYGLAQVRVATDGKSPGEVADEVIQKLR